MQHGCTCCTPNGLSLHVIRPVALAEQEGGTIALCRRQQVLIVTSGRLLDEAGLLVWIRRPEEFANHAHNVTGIAGGAVQVDFKKLGHGSDGAPAWRPKQVGGTKPVRKPYMGRKAWGG